MIHGSCLRGKVRFRLSTHPPSMDHRQCILCPKVSRTGFDTLVQADGRPFAWRCVRESGAPLSCWNRAPRD